MTSVTATALPDDLSHDLAVTRRFEAHWPTIQSLLAGVYGQDPRWTGFISRLRQSVLAAATARPAVLQPLDAEREARPDWLAAPGQTTYTFYVDRFAGDLNGVRQRLDYLTDLGVRWLHPLPLLEPREGDSDGGFAVKDYRQVDPRLGTMQDLSALAADLRARGMGLILDVVCNHTAREHAWAVAARAGDPAYRDFYIVVSPEEAARRDAELIDVFPDTAPGSFTPCPELGGHVWTTFYPFQWDLNYANPAVFAEMLDVLVFLAAEGVQGFRLDSAPFLWKQDGTTCRNLPQTYAIVEAWRAALSIIAPGVVLVAEAIESLEDVLPFFGEGRGGCDLAYNNGVMTSLWGALADEDAGIFRRCLSASAGKPARAAWLNYVRCHDDVIWNALATYAPHADLARWSRFYGGQDQSFSRGRAFQTAAGGVPSTNGMAASLAGIGPGDGGGSAGAARLALLYGIIHGLDGWPLIYMGDEIGLADDALYTDDPLRAGDGRWLHRPMMDWSLAARRDDETSLEGRLFNRFRTLANQARKLDEHGVAGPARPVDLGVVSVLAFERTGGARGFLCLANLSGSAVSVDLPHGFGVGATDLLGATTPKGGSLTLPGHGLAWLVTL
jgi:amylosucrase